MVKILHCLIIFAATLSSCQALICYKRSTASSTDNGVLEACASVTSCYSYSIGSTPVNYYAGCGSVCSPDYTPSCVMCNTDYCNSQTPSNISCYHHHLPASSSVGNGTIAPCSAGINTCYSASALDGNYEAGCGTCPSRYSKDCTSCSTPNCNTRTPSSISCHFLSQVTGANYSISCATGITSCYSFSSAGSSRFAGCGTCKFLPLTDTHDCTTCSTDYCNTLTPSSISCYYRWQSSSSSNGTVQQCAKGTSTCFSYGDSLSSSGGCGVCNTSISKSCVTCTTDYCNSLTPSSISCYSRYGYTSNNNGAMVSCSTAVSTCYLYSDGYSYYSAQYSGGCGVCDADSTVKYGCKTCSTDYCNSVTTTAKATSTATTRPTTSTVAIAGIATATTATPDTSFSIKCYTRHAASIGVNGAVTTCTSGIATCYSYIDESLQKSYAGCGTCSTTSGSSCTICSADLCNAAAFSCFARATLSSSYNGTVSTCSSGVSSCYSYTSGVIRHAGCGTCALASPDADCTSCTGHLCNHQALPINCWSSFGDSKYSDRKKTTCTARSCYEYSYGSYSLFFAGCGDCPVSTRNSNCRTCSTEYCNSAAAAADGGGAIRLGMRMACFVLLALVKFFWN